MTPGRTLMTVGTVGAVPPKRRLRLFDRQGKPQLLVEVLDDPDLVLAVPDKAGDVLIFDRYRRIFLPRQDANDIHGRQGKGMTGEEMGAPIVVIHRQIEVADAQIERIALVEIGGLRRTQPIELAVPRKMRRRIDVTPYKDSSSAAACGKVKLARVATRNIGEGNVLKGRRDIRADEFVAGHSCELEEAAGRDGDIVNKKARWADIRITLEFRFKSNKAASLIRRRSTGGAEANCEG